jgi:hypothetical protein
MIPLPTGVRVWIAAGHTDMRRGMQGLARQVQQALQRAPHAGDLYVFRGRGGSLVKILWHEGIGMSLYAKAAGARPVHLAIASGRRRFDLGIGSSRTCWTESTGGIRSRLGGRDRPDELRLVDSAD